MFTNLGIDEMTFAKRRSLAWMNGLIVIGAIGLLCSGCSHDDAPVQEKEYLQTVILVSTLPSGQEIRSHIDMAGDTTDDDIVALLTKMMSVHGGRLPEGRFRSDGIVFVTTLIVRTPLEVVVQSDSGPVTKTVDFECGLPHFGLVQLEDGRYFYAKTNDSVWPGPGRKRHEGYFGTLEEASESLARGMLPEIREAMSSEGPALAPVLAEPDKANSS